MCKEKLTPSQKKSNLQGTRAEAEREIIIKKMPNSAAKPLLHTIITNYKVQSQKTTSKHSDHKHRSRLPGILEFLNKLHILISQFPKRL